MLNMSRIQSAFFFFSYKRNGQEVWLSSPPRPLHHRGRGSGTKPDAPQALRASRTGVMLSSGWDGRCSQGRRCGRGGRPCSTGEEPGLCDLPTGPGKLPSLFLCLSACGPPSEQQRRRPPAFLSSRSFCREKEACDLLPSQGPPGEGARRPRSGQRPAAAPRGYGQGEGLKRTG